METKTEPCKCGRGQVHYFMSEDGFRMGSRHTVWNEGMTIDGRPEMVPCCKHCYDDSIAELNRYEDTPL